MRKILLYFFRTLFNKVPKLRRLAHKLVQENLAAGNHNGDPWFRRTLESATTGIATDAEVLARLLSNPDLPGSVSGSPKAETALLELLRKVTGNTHMLSDDFVEKAYFNRVLAEKPGIAPQHLMELANFLVFMKKVAPDLSPTFLAGLDIVGIAGQLGDPKKTRAVFNANFCHDEAIPLSRGQYRFPDPNSAWVQLHEIFVNEEYGFNCDGETPNILDVGTHMGMGIYYFKTRFPKAHVTGFEPNPALRDIALENMGRCGFDGVEILPYALGGEDKTVSFFVAKKDSMASSLMARPRQGEEYDEIEVECRRLSAWLDKPVDFLKIDIEGEEDKVLEECRERLHRVHYLFCEYHQGDGLAASRLPAMLKLLDEQGFDFHVGKAWSWQNMTQERPLDYVSRPYSAIIWAKNKTWPPSVI